MKINTKIKKCNLITDPMDSSLPGFSVHVSLQDRGSRFPFLPPGDHLDPGIESSSLTSLAGGGKFFIISITWKAPCFHTLD